MLPLGQTLISLAITHFPVNVPEAFKDDFTIKHGVQPSALHLLESSPLSNKHNVCL